MKIALLGYGKMGKTIEDLAESRGHHIELKAGRDGFSDEQIQKCDVAIEFSTPDAAPGNIRRCLVNGIPVVVGTTAWYDHYQELKNLSEETATPMLTATNFSIGVNLFFALNRYLARLMDPYEDYNVHLEEIHHTEKKDSPSGTAITLAEGIVEVLERKKQWVCQKAHNNPDTDPFTLSIDALRISGVPGTHSVMYDSEIDSIEIKHTAHNRKGFALGAILAAEWLPGKVGVFSMHDVLNI